MMILNFHRAFHWLMRLPTSCAHGVIYWDNRHPRELVHVCCITMHKITLQKSRDIFE